MNEMRITTNSMTAEGNQLILEVDNNNNLAGLKATGQMLVDSEGLSFIYLLENEDDRYTYISIPDLLWNGLKQARQEKLTVTLTNGNESIPLTQFFEELDYLIENIKGNSNYGEKMVNKVEKVFA